MCVGMGNRIILLFNTIISISNLLFLDKFLFAFLIYPIYYLSSSTVIYSGSTFDTTRTNECRILLIIKGLKHYYTLFITETKSFPLPPIMLSCSTTITTRTLFPLLKIILFPKEFLISLIEPLVSPNPGIST